MDEEKRGCGFGAPCLRLRLGKGGTYEYDDSCSSLQEVRY